LFDVFSRFGLFSSIELCIILLYQLRLSAVPVKQLAAETTYQVAYST